VCVRYLYLRDLLGGDVDAAELGPEGVLRDVLHLLDAAHILHLRACALEQVIRRQLRPPHCTQGYQRQCCGMGKKSGSGSGMNSPDHISESLETIFWVKIL
jgi:hypothetical protein